MKMIKAILLFCLLFASLSLQGCKTAAVENLQTQNEQTAAQTQINNFPNANNAEQKIEKTNATSQTVNFKGVSFNYNPQIFDEVITKEITEDEPLESETDKPNENFPKHLEFYFKQTDAANHSIDRGRIAVVSIENYRKMFIVSNQMVKAFDDSLRNIQKVLANKNFRVGGEIPYLPFYDAHETFVAKAKIVSFANGKGIFFLTQINQEAILVNNDELVYIFQGISGDGKNYVFAQFSPSVSFLPGLDEEEFEGYKISQYYSEKSDGLKQYKQYLAKITKRLENLPSDKYEPNLKYFEEIISSMKIEK